MPAQIPEPFKWDKSFEVFYAQLDKEHQGLFDGIFACCEARGDSGKFNSLYALLDSHFKYEEGLMKDSKYPDYESHQKIHNEFLAKVKGLALPLSDDSVHFAKNWLVNHIVDIDFKYKGKLA
jgi:hemerythrin family non-heme iron protein